MGLFKKKKEEKKEDSVSLPELPKLPDFSDLEKENFQNLPSFPENSIGKKFSQDTIKNAVSGSFDENEEEDYSEIEKLKKRRTLELGEDEKIPSTEKLIEEKGAGKIFQEKINPTNEPIFVRIDKFEDALKVFKKTKSNLINIEKLIEEIKKVREKEETDLKKWENDVKLMKEHIEKVEENIFSKI